MKYLLVHSEYFENFFHLKLKSYQYYCKYSISHSTAKKYFLSFEKVHCNICGSEYSHEIMNPITPFSLKWKGIESYLTRV